MSGKDLQMKHAAEEKQKQKQKQTKNKLEINLKKNKTIQVMSNQVWLCQDIPDEVCNGFP